MEKLGMFAIFTFPNFFYRTLKIVLDVVATFPERLWKAQGPYFSFPNSNFKFVYFCNPNGIHAFLGQNQGVKKFNRFVSELKVKKDRYHRKRQYFLKDG